MPGLSDILRGGGPAAGPDQGPPPSPADTDAGGNGKGMSPQAAVKVMQKFGISPADVPMIKEAVDVLAPMLSGKGGDQDQDEDQSGPAAPDGGGGETDSDQPPQGA